MLQAILGLTAAEIGAAFLVPPATMGQRLSRAKARLREAGRPLALPPLEAWPARLSAVLEAVYAGYAKGWSALGEPEGEALAGEALWLGQVLAALLPGEAEALGLLALMLYAEARRTARRSPAGDYAPLDEQDTALWDSAMIARAEALLSQASALAGPSGRFQIEAAIQSAHVARRLSGIDAWPDILALYDHLQRLATSPVVALNRALVLARIEGPEAGLSALRRLGEDGRLADYQPYWAALGRLCAEAGEATAAIEALTLACGLSDDPAVRIYLQGEIARLKALALQ
jgi:RNA polymerase sigma-70 factor (ECF subfamily)